MHSLCHKPIMIFSVNHFFSLVKLKSSKDLWCFLSFFFFYRPYWRCYYSNTDAIIYVVDSMDRERIGISKQELIAMLEVECITDALKKVKYLLQALKSRYLSCFTTKPQVYKVSYSIYTLPSFAICRMRGFPWYGVH